MNFLNFLTSGASLLNFNLQNWTSGSAISPSTEAVKSSEPLQESNELTIKMKQQMEVLSSQQQLINQYMHMNIQLLSQKLNNLEKIPAKSSEQKIKPIISKDDQSSQVKNPIKKNKKIIKCGHDDRQHYAKGLCNNCYHKYGRNKKPWNCPHQKLYAAGMCQNCYINNYNRKKRMSRDNQTDQVEGDFEAKMQELIQNGEIIEMKNKDEEKKDQKNQDQ